MRRVCLPVKAEQLVANLWYGDGAAASVARALLAPASLLFGIAVRVRNVLYDAEVLQTHRSLLRTISIGNLSVGGTGKTPVAAYFVRRLVERGATPALLIRGYGRDEAEVHRQLNPGTPVIVSADRYVAAQMAAHDYGCNVVVMDDGFQHRSMARDIDVVIVSADSFARSHRMLPAGPLREGLWALRRATHIIITRKAADDAAVAAVREIVLGVAPDLPHATVSLRPHSLRSDGSDDLDLNSLMGKSVLMIAAIGDPESFRLQLASLGAKVTAAVFADHHEFRASEVEKLASAAADHDVALCTLKDAVKILPFWPRATIPLWYVSQSVEVEQGAGTIDQMLDALVTHEP